jgi:MYXO-CTERM domain-containing protein
MYDPANDCDAGGGTAEKSGCCEVGGTDGRQLVLAALVGLLLVRPRRKRA